MKWAMAFGVAALALFALALMAQEAVACRVIPTPMPIIRPIDRPAQRPLETKSHIAEVSIKGPVATVAVNAVFYNPNPYVLEGTYFFPLEAGAAVDSFEMNINGKMVKGELLDADKARGIYEDIVRKMKDPGLLEFVGTQMLKCRVYPMNPNSETVVKLTYSLALRSEGGLYEFTYPLRSAKPEAGKIGTTALRVRIEEKEGVKTVYSPTHKVDTTRKGDQEVSLGFEEANLDPERDFKLYFSVSAKDIGVSAITHKPAGEDGYFLLSVVPKVEEDPGQVTAKSILFVLDTSGSMAGEKLRQAKAALAFCVNSLREGDQFGLIPFATEPTAFREELVAATKDNVKAALEFIEKIEARGGTAINDAVLMALKTMKGAKGLPMIVFLTDGLPTIGEANVEAILKNVAGANADKARIFVFGVGYDVNTALLDKLAGDNHGSPDYVTEKENIEIKVSNFYQKVASPVLTDPKLEMVGLKTADVYPRQMPDLFRGMQLMVLGRYEGGGAKAIKLSGTVGGKPREFVYETTFAETTENSFLPRLWSTRKVAFLLDEIRLRGKSQELVDEVVRLGKRYGIMTPYTSFLVIEDGARPGVGGPPVALRGGGRVLEEERKGREAVDTARSVMRGKEAGQLADLERMPVPAEEPAGQKEGGGERRDHRPAFPAKPSAPTIGFDERAEKAVREFTADKVLQIGDKTFYRKADGVLYDSLYDEARDKDKVVEVKAFSDEYFELVKKNPRVGRYLAEGKPMVVCFDGKVYKIIKEGSDR